jgi:hypothetical protein
MPRCLDDEELERFARSSAVSCLGAPGIDAAAIYNPGF